MPISEQLYLAMSKLLLLASNARQAVFYARLLILLTRQVQLYYSPMYFMTILCSCPPPWLPPDKYGTGSFSKGDEGKKRKYTNNSTGAG